MLIELAPVTIWGLFARALGLVYLISFVSLYHQILPLAGSRGISPAVAILQQMRRDLPFHHRLLSFPTVFWISANDTMLRAVVATGAVAALNVIVGGEFSRWALLACWMVYLSIDTVVHLTYPWDGVLFEAGFLALFLAPLEALPSLNASAEPLPMVSLAFNLLLARVLWGFGKYKFIGMTRMDSGYLRAFLINQPITSVIGWYAHRLPRIFHQLGLTFLFLVEIPLPFMIFASGLPRLAAFGGTVLLMLAIQLCGNFGYFNLIVAVLCIPLLDPRSPLTLFDVEVVVAYPLTHLVVGVLLLAPAVGFVFNSWCDRAWPYWPAVARTRVTWLRLLLDAYRALTPFRLMHAYGVFPPHSTPGVRFIPVIEGSHDGQHWREYEYRVIPCTEASPPRNVAPHHPHLDHLVFYEGHGFSANEFMSSTLGGCHDPYLFSASPALVRMMQRLSEPRTPVLALFRRNPFEGEMPPRWFRATLYVLIPTTPTVLRQSGRWWTRRRLGLHVAPFEAGEHVFAEWLNGPELFHWDNVVWRRRAPALARFENVAASGASIAQIERLATTYLDAPPTLVSRFWDEFLPSVQPRCRDDWRDLKATVRCARRRISRPQLRQFERLAALLALALAARLEARDDPNAPLPLPSYFHLGLLAYGSMLDGRKAYASTLDYADEAVRRANSLRTAEGAWLWALFRPEILLRHARYANLGMRQGGIAWNPILPGFVLLAQFLVEQDSDDLEPFVLSRSVHNGDWIVEMQDAGTDDERREAACR